MAPAGLILPRQDLGAKIWDQRLWDFDGSVRLLIILENSQPGAADRQTRSVQSMNEFGLCLSIAPEPDLGTSGLEGFAV